MCDKVLRHWCDAITCAALSGARHHRAPHPSSIHHEMHHSKCNCRTTKKKIDSLYKITSNKNNSLLNSKQFEFNRRQTKTPFAYCNGVLLKFYYKSDSIATGTALSWFRRTRTDNDILLNQDIPTRTYSWIKTYQPGHTLESRHTNQDILLNQDIPTRTYS